MRAILAAALLLALAVPAHADDGPLRVGSKRFTESYILGEIVVQAARASGAPAEHRPGLGNTAILLAALEKGAIDVYPEYTGT
ncbi:MAG TPA: glycine betaine ABC transporter substrate-binding protein, partial [Usitatibacter sp.]